MKFFTPFNPSLLSMLMLSLVESSSLTQRNLADDMTGMQVHVRLLVEFDNFPAESGFTLISVVGTTKEVVVDRPFGTFTNQDSLYKEDFNLLPGLYELEFKDSVGDGICCVYGNGTYELFTIIDDGNEEEEGVVLVTSTGVFGYSEVTPFTVAEPDTTTSSSSSPNPSPVDDDDDDATTFSPTSSPTLADGTPPPTSSSVSSGSSCMDEADGIIYIDADVGEKNCEWIVLNMIRYGYLCEFLDVAVICKATCNACEYFV